MELLARYKTYMPLLPVILLVLSGIYTSGIFINKNWTEPELSYFADTRYKFYMGMAATFICGVAFFFARRFYKYLVIATLLAGLSGTLVFSWYDLKTTYFIGPIYLKPSALLVTLLTTVLFYNRGFKVDSQREAKVLSSLRKAEQEEIEKFKSVYANKSVEGLREIIGDERYSNSAVEAAAELLREKLKEDKHQE